MSGPIVTPARSKVRPEARWRLPPRRSAVRTGGFDRVDYLELRDAVTLEPAADLARPARILAAAWIGTTRLIDNVPVRKKR